jgi:hypothetical protein
VIATLFSINQNLNTVKDSSDMKSFITRDNDITEEAEETKQPVCNVLNYLKVVNQTK